MMRQALTQSSRRLGALPRRGWRALAGPALALAVFGSAPAFAQTLPSEPVPSPRFSLFGRQSNDSDLTLRIDQLEAQIRNLTGQIEQYEFRIRQLEENLRRFQEDAEFRFRELGANGSDASRQTGSAGVPSRPMPEPPHSWRPQNFGGANPPAPQQPSSQPQTYGGIRPLAPPPGAGFPAESGPMDISPPGLGGAQPGFDGTPPSLGGAGPFPPPSGSNPAEVTLAVPTDPQTAYDVAYAFILQRDYEAAQSAFADFLVRYPQDKLAANAQYWFGESLYAQGEYREAADAFLTGYRRFGSSNKAPDSLLKLAMSLQALGQKEAACASFDEFGQKFPKASTAMKDRARAERKGAGC
ncbi:MAG: tol-pal system protein YbgF [Hyphomicrobiales bacterium]|nr:tol-pal system protein YbgF [Hyphomicrobiales bacterium]